MRITPITVGIILLISHSASAGDLKLAKLAPGLSIPLEGGKCRYGQKELANIESDRQDARESTFRTLDTYGGDWSCIMLQRHIKRDTRKGCLPDPEQALAFVPQQKLTIEGKV